MFDSRPQSQSIGMGSKTRRNKIYKMEFMKEKLEVTKLQHFQVWLPSTKSIDWYGLEDEKKENKQNYEFPQGPYHHVLVRSYSLMYGRGMEQPRKLLDIKLWSFIWLYLKGSTKFFREKKELTKLVTASTIKDREDHTIKFFIECTSCSLEPCKYTFAVSVLRIRYF